MRLLEKLVAELGEHGVYCDLVTEYADNALAEKRIVSDQTVILDFSEHDKKVTKEKDKRIAELEKQIGDYRARNMLLRQCCKGEAVEFFDRNLFGSLIISCPPLIDAKRVSELEDRHQSDCIRINQLLTTIDVLTERYQKLRDFKGL